MKLFSGYTRHSCVIGMETRDSCSRPLLHFIDEEIRRARPGLTIFRLDGLNLSSLGACGISHRKGQTVAKMIEDTCMHSKKASEPA